MALALVVLTVATAPLGATTIIVLRSPARIVLAGDSRATVAGADGQVRVRGGDCKVRRAGRWWFVAGGFSGSVGVDVRTVVAEALSPTHTMPEALAALRRVYDAQLRAGLAAAEFFYAKPERLGTPALAVYVAGLSEGALTLGTFGADVASIRPFSLVTYGSTCPGPLCRDGSALFLGNSVSGEPALKLLRTTPRPDWIRADAAAARRLIELQAAATPERVGGAIDVLEVTAAGARWVDRENGSACAFDTKAVSGG